MPYTTYKFYENTYKGSKVSLEEFDYYNAQASYELNYICHGKINLDTLSKFNTEIQLATCSIIDELFNYIENDGKTLSSETVDSWHRTFASSGNEEINYKLVSSINKYLMNTGLLYRGI